MFQFGGPAAWSIGFGLVAIATPFVSSVYFKFVPVVGIVSGIRALMRGRIIGGSIGLALNVVAAVVSFCSAACWATARSPKSFSPDVDQYRTFVLYCPVLFCRFRRAYPLAIGSMVTVGVVALVVGGVVVTQAGVGIAVAGWIAAYVIALWFPVYSEEQYRPTLRRTSPFLRLGERGRVD
jgi:hypothetical protein